MLTAILTAVLISGAGPAAILPAACHTCGQTSDGFELPFWEDDFLHPFLWREPAAWRYTDRLQTHYRRPVDYHRQFDYSWHQRVHKTSGDYSLYGPFGGGPSPRRPVDDRGGQPRAGAADVEVLPPPVLNLGP